MCSTHGGTTDTADALVLVDQALELLRAAGHVPLGGAVTDVGLTQLAQRLEAAARVAKGHQAKVVAEIDQRHAARGQSAAATEDLLTRALHWTSGEARAHKALATGLALVPDTAKALADGRIGVGQATVTVRKAVEVAGRDDAQALLATIDRTASTAGQTLNRTRLAREIDTAVARTGVDVLAERERTAFRRRRLEWSVRDGMDVLTAHLDPVGAATVRGMLDALSDKTDEADTRTFVQRQADALVHMSGMARAADGAPQSTLQSARVLLITTSDALHDVPGADPAVLDGHGPVSTRLARQLCCDARGGRHHRRSAKPKAALALAVPPPRYRAARAWARALKGFSAERQARAAGPGARRTPHHIQWWSDGGPTNLDNLVLVCWRCHTHIHQDGWHVTRDTTGRYTAAPPGHPPDAPPEPLHIDKSIAKREPALAHSH